MNLCKLCLIWQKKKLIPQRLWIYIKKIWTLQKFSFSFFSTFLLLLFVIKEFFFVLYYWEFFSMSILLWLLSSSIHRNFPHIQKKIFSCLFYFLYIDSFKLYTKDYKIRAWMKNLCKRFFPVIVLHIFFVIIIMIEALFEAKNPRNTRVHIWNVLIIFKIGRGQ